MNIRTTIVWVLTALTVLPLLVASNLWYGDVDAKMLALQGVAALVSLLVCIGVYIDRSFRDHLSLAWQRLACMSLPRALGMSLVLLTASALTAIHPVLALFGEPQRGEGLLTIVSLFVVYLATTLFFTPRDWKRFFSWTLAVAAVVFCIQVGQAIDGMARPGATLGNPIFLAGYYLFVLLCAYELRQYRVLAACAGSMALIGIMLTQSRGVFLGALVGLLVVAIARAIRMPSLRVGRMPIRRAVLVLCILLTATVGTVYVTRTSSLWKHVPVIGRITAISSQDATTHSRLLFSEIGLSGWWADRTPTRVLLGVGGENFVYVWMKHYDPHVYFYDTAIADRAHNKLVDVLVMTGMLGLAAYLAVWFFAVRTALRLDGALGGGVLFFLVAYFIQNLFAFDSIVTYVALYLVWAYTSSLALPQKPQARGAQRVSLQIGTTVVAVCLCTVYVLYALVPYMRMHSILSQIAPTLRGESTVLLDTSAWEYAPDHLSLVNAQALVDTVLAVYTKGELTQTTPLLAVATDHLAEVAARDDSTCTTCYLSLGKGYDLLARLSTGEARAEYFQKADAAFTRGLERFPQNPALRYAYALHLSDEGRVDESLAVLEGVLRDDPRILQTRYFLGMVLYQKSPQNAVEALTQIEQVLAEPGRVQSDPATMKILYTKMFRHFYEEQDREHFVIVARRLAILDPQQATVYGNIVTYVQEHGSIPLINFNAN